jgi:DNA-binding MarR family transcriptional regulator
VSPPPPPPRTLPAATDALLAVAPLVTRWTERLLAAHEPPLTPAQYLGLRAIGRESLGAVELARRTGVSGPAVSQLVAGLAEAGLLERRVAEEDRRRQALALTGRGERVLASANRLIQGRLEDLLEGLPRPEADALARALPRVEELLSGAPPPRRPPPPPPRRPPRP